MGDTCTICRRPLDNTPGNNSDAVCWRDVLPPKDGDYWNERDARECYRLGYYRSREALAAANARAEKAERQLETGQIIFAEVERQRDLARADTADFKKRLEVWDDHLAKVGSVYACEESLAAARRECEGLRKWSRRWKLRTVELRRALARSGGLGNDYN